MNLIAMLLLLVVAFVFGRFVRPVTSRERVMLAGMAQGSDAAHAAAAPALSKRWLQAYEWRLTCRQVAKVLAEQQLQKALGETDRAVTHG